MTREDIIWMAREAGAWGYIHDAGDAPHKWQFTLEEIERFAALVAAAELEACAKACEEEICNCCWDDDAQAAAEHLAAAIRARGEK